MPRITPVVSSRLDLVALSLLWTEGANRRPIRRAGGPDPATADTVPPDPRTLLDLEEVLALIGVPDVRACAAGLRHRACRALDDAAAKGIGLVVRGDSAYPERLESLPDPPPALWTRGQLGPCDFAVAIVGSRTATPHGLEFSYRLGRDLAREGFPVVSGLARGVDAAAHRGALCGGGRTLAVLGCGVDVAYPPEHASLTDEIAASGTVLSEFAPGLPPQAWHFPRRNRIISGICLGVVIVEASCRSGSLITARCAAEQGRSVMAVPGAVLSGRNRGAHRLLKDGAGVVEDARDVITQLEADWHKVFHPDPPPAPAPEPPEKGPGPFFLDPIVQGMEPGEVYRLEDLAGRMELTTVELMARLAHLEVGGAILRVEGGGFVKAGANVLR